MDHVWLRITNLQLCKVIISLLCCPGSQQQESSHLLTLRYLERARESDRGKTRSMKGTPRLDILRC